MRRPCVFHRRCAFEVPALSVYAAATSYEPRRLPVLKEKIGVIGAGKIGAAIMRGIVRSGLAGKDQVMASDVSEQLRDAVVKELAINATPDNGVLCNFADIVILAVKPQI